MRVIAGALKGRRLAAPAWEGLRPTSDRLRETLFNVLAPRISGARVLDLYAGTGALGIEALSRGAASIVFVESDRRAQVLIAENLRICGVDLPAPSAGRGRRGGEAAPEEAEGRPAACAIIRATAARALETLSARGSAPFDIVLLDPPYDQRPADVLEGLDRVLAPDGLVVLEHATRSAAPARAGRLVKRRDLPSGDSTLSIYSVPE